MPRREPAARADETSRWIPYCSFGIAEGMGLPTIAILDDQLPTKIQHEKGELDDVEVVWTGQSVEELARRLPQLRPQVLVLQLEHLGSEPIAQAQQLTQLADAELTIVTYAFARREVIKGLQKESVRPIRAPLTLPALRAQMTSVIVRSLMSEAEPPPAATDAIRPPLYARDQLALLGSLPSSVECECPQHLATILSSLSYFEDYCKRCENTNEQDAMVHRMLYEQTARARMLVEEGLKLTLEHEGIEV